MDITTIKYPSHADLVQWYYQLAQKIAEGEGVTPEEVNALIEAYIAEHPYPVVPADIITVSNAPSNVVTSVNGEKGDVTVASGGDVPENVITEDNIAENAVTSFNGEKGDVTGVASVNGQTGDVMVPGVPANVVTSDNIADQAVTSFNGHNGSVTYTPPVSSVNGLTGDLFTTIYRSSGGIWVYGLKVSNTRAIIFGIFPYTFEGIDITYNTTIPEDLNIKPLHILSWLPDGDTFSAVNGAHVNYENRTLKVKVDAPDTSAVIPPKTIWACTILYGDF